MKVFRSIIITIVVLSGSIIYSQNSTKSIQEIEIQADVDKLMIGFENLQEAMDKLSSDKERGVVSVEEIDRREAEISDLENKLISLDKSIAVKKENLKNFKNSPIVNTKTEPGSKRNIAASNIKIKPIEKRSSNNNRNQRKEVVQSKEEVAQLKRRIKLNTRILSIGEEELNKNKHKMENLDIGVSISEVSQLAAKIKQSEKMLKKIKIENKVLRQKLSRIN